VERSGLIAERATQTISATMASPEVADGLQLDLGSPLIALPRIVYDRSARGIEHLHALYRPDRYSFQFDLVRTGGTGRRRWTPAVVSDDALPVDAVSSSARRRRTSR
jgi:GntR family transcriptional regulator